MYKEASGVKSRHLRIKKERNYICEYCGEDHLEKQSLDVHHIDCNPANDNFDNLMVLCRKCHNNFHYFIDGEKSWLKRARIIHGIL